MVSGFFVIGVVCVVFALRALLQRHWNVAGIFALAAIPFLALGAMAFAYFHGSWLERMTRL